MGKRHWVAERTADVASTSGCEEAEAASQTVVYVGVEGRGLVGRMAFSDVLREDAADVVRRLHMLGIRVMLLSGDRATAAAGIAQQVSQALHVRSHTGLEMNSLSSPCQVVGRGTVMLRPYALPTPSVESITPRAQREDWQQHDCLHHDCLSTASPLNASTRAHKACRMRSRLASARRQHLGRCGRSRRRLSSGTCGAGAGG